MRKQTLLLTVILTLVAGSPALARRGGPPSDALVQAAIEALQRKEMFGSLRSQYQSNNDGTYLGELLILANTLTDEIARVEAIANRRIIGGGPSVDTAAMNSMRRDIARIDSAIGGFEPRIDNAVQVAANEVLRTTLARVDPLAEDVERVVPQVADLKTSTERIDGKLDELLRGEVPGGVPYSALTPLPRIVAGVGVVVVSAVLFALTRAQ